MEARWDALSLGVFVKRSSGGILRRSLPKSSYLQRRSRADRSGMGQGSPFQSLSCWEAAHMRKMSKIHERREFLRTSATAAVGLSCFGVGLKAPSLAPGFPPEDPPNTHNMMIVGEKTVYLSHLPMFVKKGRPAKFNSPHRFQVILEATFSDRTRDLTADYFSDRVKNPSVKMYTLNPAEFVLSRLNPAGMALKKFQGNTIFRGHLEREGQPFIDFSGNRPPAPATFDVNVKRVVHFHQFDPKATKPARLEYLLFGKGAELFLAHFITKPDDFDQILSVKI